MRKAISTLVAAGVLAATLGGVAPVASAATGYVGSRASVGHVQVVPTPTVTTDAVATRQFIASGTLGRYYTEQTVTGTYYSHATRGTPTNVTVYNWQGVALVFAERPRLHEAWWGNYWHDTYGLDQWYVGRSGSDSCHLMLPPAPMGSTFTALLVTEFGPGGINGNWQNWMDGTST